MNRDELIASLRVVAQDAPLDVIAIYLYGSWARDQARADSDVDLAFWRTAPSEARFEAQPYALAASFEAVLGREVDLVELNRAPPDLCHEVLRDGLIVLDRLPEARVRMEIRARAEYLDMLPVLRRYRAPKAAS